MISRISGTIVHADPRYLIVDVHGVGYKVYTTAGFIEKQLNETVTFWTYLVVREDVLDLYGFPTRDELSFFELLISVSGIGPKSALAILNLANPATIRKAILMEDPAYLTKTSGIGKKNAEKIVLELKDKIAETEDDANHDAAHSHSDDALEALKSLGYPEKDARDALKKVPKGVTDTSECIKLALKVLGSGK